MDLAPPRRPRRGPVHVGVLVHGGVGVLLEHQEPVGVDDVEVVGLQSGEDADDADGVVTAAELVDGERVVGQEAVPGEREPLPRVVGRACRGRAGTGRPRRPPRCGPCRARTRAGTRRRASARCGASSSRWRSWCLPEGTRCAARARSLPSYGRGTSPTRSRTLASVRAAIASARSAPALEHLERVALVGLELADARLDGRERLDDDLAEVGLEVGVALALVARARSRRRVRRRARCRCRADW